MGLTKKEKERMKKMTEERSRKRRERSEQHEAREAGPAAKLGAALRHQPADPASATPPLPPLPTTSPQQTSNPASRSSFKLDNVPEVEIKETSHRRYRIVDIDNVIEWATRFARCECGRKMNVKEVLGLGNVSHLVSTCSDCDKEFKMCTSTGGVTKSLEIRG